MFEGKTKMRYALRSTRQRMKTKTTLFSPRMVLRSGKQI